MNKCTPQPVPKGPMHLPKAAPVDLEKDLDNFNEQALRENVVVADLEICPITPDTDAVVSMIPVPYKTNIRDIFATKAGPSKKKGKKDQCTQSADQKEVVHPEEIPHTMSKIITLTQELRNPNLIPYLRQLILEAIRIGQEIGSENVDISQCEYHSGDKLFRINTKIKAAPQEVILSEEIKTLKVKDIPGNPQPVVVTYSSGNQAYTREDGKIAVILKRITSDVKKTFVFDPRLIKDWETMEIPILFEKAMKKDKKWSFFVGVWDTKNAEVKMP